MNKINLSNISLNKQSTIININSKSNSTIYNSKNNINVNNSNVSLILENGMFYNIILINSLIHVKQ